MYFDLVAVKQNGGVYLFQAPAWTRIEPGETVVVDTKRGQAEGVVLASVTTSENENVFQFAVASHGATLPLKRVLAVKKLKKLDYPADNPEEKVEAMA